MAKTTFSAITNVEYVQNMENMSQTILMLVKTLDKMRAAFDQLYLDNIKLAEELRKQKERR